MTRAQQKQYQKYQTGTPKTKLTFPYWILARMNPIQILDLMFRDFGNPSSHVPWVKTVTKWNTHSGRETRQSWPWRQATTWQRSSCLGKHNINHRLFNSCLCQGLVKIRCMINAWTFGALVYPSNHFLESLRGHHGQFFWVHRTRIILKSLANAKTRLRTHLHYKNTWHILPKRLLATCVVYRNLKTTSTKKMKQCILWFTTRIKNKK